MERFSLANLIKKKPIQFSKNIQIYLFTYIWEYLKELNRCIWVYQSPSSQCISKESVMAGHGHDHGQDQTRHLKFCFMPPSLILLLPLPLPLWLRLRLLTEIMIMILIVIVHYSLCNILEVVRLILLVQKHKIDTRSIRIIICITILSLFYLLLWSWSHDNISLLLLLLSDIRIESTLTFRVWWDDA